jgi:hypothetical protein
MGTFFGDDAETEAAIAKLREELRAEVRDELLAVRREVAELRSAETEIAEPTVPGGQPVSRRALFRVGGAALAGAAVAGVGLVAAAGPAAAATTGSVVFLPTPVRLLDTRSGLGTLFPAAQLAPANFITLQVTGTTSTIPTGSLGVFGTLTATRTGAPGGDLILYPQGVATPTASNINWFAAGQTVATAAVVGLNITNGQIIIYNGGSGPTDVIFDAIAYVSM